MSGVRLPLMRWRITNPLAAWQDITLVRISCCGQLWALALFYWRDLMTLRRSLDCPVVSLTQLHYVRLWLERDPMAALNYFSDHARLSCRASKLPYEKEDLLCGVTN